MEKTTFLRLLSTSLLLTAATVARAQDPFVPFFRSFSGLFTDSTDDGTNNFTAPGTDIDFQDTAIPVNTAKSIFGNYNGATVSSYTHSDYAGFFAAKNYAQLAVTNVQNEGYYAIAGRGSHTTVEFFTPGALAERAVFHWHVTGNSNTPLGVAGSRIDFAAGSYGTTDFNGFFSIPTGPRMEEYGPGNFTYTLPMTLNQPIDLFYWSSAYIQINQPETTGHVGSSLSALADFSNTYVLDSIDLYDGSNTRLTSWTMQEVSSGEVMFNQDGRTAAAGSSAPEPTSLCLLVIGGTLVVVRRRRHTRAI